MGVKIVAIHDMYLYMCTEISGIMAQLAKWGTEALWLLFMTMINHYLKWVA